jgi:hypothetical protein
MAGEVETFVRPLIAIFIGVALIPVVQQYITNANLTGSSAVLVGLIPFFYGLTVFLYSIKGIAF